ncbi:glycosyltransferase [Dyella acidiphila]|uniref:Glycosyltransferase n=1 Tax=Dyella acidiphila TaxID=2775866 RepID=A0ABR9G587_9GAMM|nr:glycosyltransferase [Dyella acidiphila]MBE1159202.1 glycosyltransferase [Dyella acidiphila]
MKLIIHTSTPEQDLAKSLGKPEYSYRFVVKEFRPLLEQLGTVIEVADPENDVDPIYAQCAARGEACVFLCFLPPCKTPISLECPTVPVFAWEFEVLPNEAFCGKPRNDWRRVLKRLGAALTHSSYTVARTRAEMGEDFLIESIPAPLWDRMQSVRRASQPPRVLRAKGLVIDSTRTDLHAYRKETLQAALPDTLPLPANTHSYDEQIDLEGIVYTAIFNPGDARKNWLKMICAFCEAFRDTRDATLLIKLTHHNPAAIIPNMLEAIYTMGPVRCRILFVHAYLDDDEYISLLLNSTYAVSVSTGEGQCLPLMEYMSAGIPAISCRHTSMGDYINEECAFVVDSSLEPGAWPHDQRQALRTMRQRVHHQSLVHAYRKSYHVAKHEADVYAAMSEAAVRSLKNYCSIAVVQPRLERFLELCAPEQSLPQPALSMSAASQL